MIGSAFLLATESLEIGVDYVIDNVIMEIDFYKLFVYPWVIHSQFCVLDNGYADGDCKKFRM